MDKLYYSMHKETHGKYEEAYITLHPRLAPRDGRLYDEASMHFRLELRWQREAGSDEPWYGLRFEAQGTSGKEGNLVAKTMRRVLRNLPYDPTPRDVLDKLGRLRPKAERVVYDPRIHGYMPVDEVAPATIHRYIDDYKTMGKESGATVSALVDHRADPAVKQAAIEAKLEEHVKGWLGGPKAEEYLERWREAGRPVIDASVGSMWGGSEIPTWESEEAILGEERDG